MNVCFGSEAECLIWVESLHGLCKVEAMPKRLVIILALAVSACVTEPPLMVRATGEGQHCSLMVDGVAVTSGKMDQAKLREAAKDHGRRVIIDSDSRTPYRCIGGVIFNLQAARFRTVTMRIDGVELPKP